MPKKRKRTSASVQSEADMETAFFLAKECEKDEAKLNRVFNDPREFANCFVKQARFMMCALGGDHLNLQRAKLLLKSDWFLSSVHKALALLSTGSRSWEVRLNIRAAQIDGKRASASEQAGGDIPNGEECDDDGDNKDQDGQEEPAEKRRRQDDTQAQSDHTVHFLAPRKWPDIGSNTQKHIPQRKFANGLRQGPGFVSDKRCWYLKNNCCFNAVVTILQLIAMKNIQFFMDLTANLRRNCKNSPDLAKLIELIGKNPYQITDEMEQLRGKVITTLRFRVEKTAKVSRKANLFCWMENEFELQASFGMLGHCSNCGYTEEMQKMPFLRFSDFAHLADEVDAAKLEGSIHDNIFVCNGCGTKAKHFFDFIIPTSGLVIDCKDISNNRRGYSIAYLMEKHQLCRDVYTIKEEKYEVLGVVVSEFNKARHADHVMVVTRESVPQAVNDIATMETESEAAQEASVDASGCEVLDDDDGMDTDGEFEEIEHTYFKHCDSQPNVWKSLMDSKRHRKRMQINYIFLSRFKGT